jgi:hypothetical protein
MGSVVDKALKMLRGMKRGSIAVSDSIAEEIARKQIKFVQPITTKKCGEMNDSARNANGTVHQVSSPFPSLLFSSLSSFLLLYSFFFLVFLTFQKRAVKKDFTVGVPFFLLFLVCFFFGRVFS